MKVESILFHIFKPEMLPVGIKYEEFKNIDNYSDGGLHNILIQDLLDYVDDQYILSTIELFSKKLTAGGTISIQGTDLKQLSSSLIFKDIDINTCKKILYGYNKKSIHTMSEMVKLLESVGLSILSKKYINLCEYHISAQKNEEN